MPVVVPACRRVGERLGLFFGLRGGLRGSHLAYHHDFIRLGALASSS